MQLLMSPTSPFVRKCRVLLREADLLDTVEEVTVATTPAVPDAAVASANPVAKIPVLLRMHGPAIHDSRVICRFLNEHAGANLYPATRLWETLTLEATADAIMEAAITMFYETKYRDPAQQSTDWIDAQWSKADRAITALEDRWLSHLNGPLDMGQIATACALSYIDLRHAARDWRNGRAGLAQWHATFAARPSMLETAAA
ncbi:glutathione S-transferase family protein [Loktanella sp. SALINAS62]|uniref:glutathione S-transferase family protein n=1 Tax=Loktanella sp. SALINAS62 TaxID=2706124 RepID=UPI001B8B2E6E|nr:glutathione S-transferase family protein [Loktanella sp. SALINAS62]MBS1302261.1 glutathione S-transferase family protein [Loktanella sp. SALINAS62]